VSGSPPARNGEWWARGNRRPTCGFSAGEAVLGTLAPVTVDSPAPPSGGPRAVVLLSGGLDSATCLAIAQRDGFEVVALSFRYGQRHAVELDAAARLARDAGVEHLIVDIDLGAFGGSALTDASIDVPKHESVEELDEPTTTAATPTAGPTSSRPSNASPTSRRARVVSTVACGSRRR
jgi:hypothetical protein